MWAAREIRMLCLCSPNCTAAITERHGRHVMSQVVGMKRFALKHLWSAALVFGIVISAATAVTTLCITGDLPNPRGGSSSVQPQPTLDPAAIAERERAIARLFDARWSLGVTAAQQRVAQGFGDDGLVDPNVLRGYDASPSVISLARMRFMDSNMLPDANNAAVANAAPRTISREQMLYQEMNALPGDDTAPYADLFSGKY